jgi:hypothetical protein
VVRNSRPNGGALFIDGVCLFDRRLRVRLMAGADWGEWRKSNSACITLSYSHIDQE